MAYPAITRSAMRLITSKMDTGLTPFTLFCGTARNGYAVLQRFPGCNAPSHLGTVTKVKGGCSAFSKTSVCNKLYHKMSGHSFIFFSRPNETLFIVLGFPVLVEGKEKKGC